MLKHMTTVAFPFGEALILQNGMMNGKVSLFLDTLRYNPAASTIDNNRSHGKTTAYNTTPTARKPTCRIVSARRFQKNQILGGGVKMNSLFIVMPKYVNMQEENHELIF